MPVREHENPFRPGRGGMPPCLAGRDFEQGRMSKHLRQTAAKQPPAKDIVLIGPRGNGKTVLLNWLELKADAARADVVRCTPDRIPDLDSLAEVLVPPSRAPDLIPKEVGVSLGGIVDGKWTFQANETPYARALAARCGKRPMVAMIDEAHTLEPSVARVLLNLSQTLHNERSPFLLVLAGTPGLEQSLRRANSSFQERCETLGVGRLASEAAIRAVVEPFESRGVRVNREVADRIPEKTQNYPYFTATLGDALWDALAGEGAETVSIRTSEAATDEHDRQLRVFYNRRHSELEDAKLLSAAQAAAKMFERKPQWDRHGIQAAIKGTQGVRDPEAAFDALRGLGFVWRAPGETLYTPGIPSLMRFIGQARTVSGDRGR